MSITAVIKNDDKSLGNYSPQVIENIKVEVDNICLLSRGLQVRVLLETLTTEQNQRF